MNFFVFDWEFVVVGYFFAECDRLFRINDNLLLTVDCDDLGVTIGLQKDGPFLMKRVIFNLYKINLLAFC